MQIIGVVGRGRHDNMEHFLVTHLPASHLTVKKENARQVPKNLGTFKHEKREMFGPSARFHSHSGLLLHAIEAFIRAKGDSQKGITSQKGKSLTAEGSMATGWKKIWIQPAGWKKRCRLDPQGPGRRVKSDWLASENIFWSFLPFFNKIFFGPGCENFIPT